MYSDGRYNNQRDILSPAKSLCLIILQMLDHQDLKKHQCHQHDTIEIILRSENGIFVCHER